jgi:SAM-dependent methyltransferase
MDEAFKGIAHVAHMFMIRAVESQLLSCRLSRMEGPFLDLGCGDGTFGKSLGLQNVYGIDIDEEAIKYLREDRYYTEVYHASGSKIPFRDGFFSTVFSNCAIEHMDHIDRVLMEVRRILKKSGKFIFTVPTKKLFDAIKKDRLLKRNGFGQPDALDAYNRFHHHVNIVDLDTWMEELKRRDFRVVNHKYYLRGRIGGFVARMDMLYSIGGSEAKHLINQLERKYWSLWGLPFRLYFYSYLRSLRCGNSGTHLMIEAEKA